jgi:cell cycle sensor histidine kinase DivJ
MKLMDPSHPASPAPVHPLRCLQHELRTPLNAVLGFSTLLRTRAAPLAPEQRRWVESIELAGLHMLQLVEGLARHGAGAEDAREEAPSRTRCDLHRAMRQAVGLLRFEALTCGVPLTVIGPGAGPLHVAGSETAWRQVVLNLVSNAIKYSVRGREVRVQLRSAVPPATQACLSVTDQGAGMSAEQLARLSRPYERLGRECQSASGSGLGLYLVCELARDLGARLEVESHAGAGTCITLEMTQL